jgi:hypothetical protein
MNYKEETAYLEDDEGYKIPYFKKDPKYFHRKITALYGETESGKSTIIQNIMYILRKIIPNVIIFSPTNVSNNLYTEKVNKPGIFPKLSMEILEEINERQKDAVKIYDMANNMDIMKSVFLKIADDRTLAIVNSVNRDAARHIELAANRYTDPGMRKSEEMKIKTMRDNALRKTYKLCIEANQRTLLKDPTLTEDQYIAVYYYAFVPDLLLIFDDCASFFVDHKNEPLIKDMFYQGRHDALTSVFSFQGDKNLPPDLRRAAHTSIFTTQACANAYVGCAGNGITGDKTLRRRWEKAASRIFRPDGDMPTYRKLVYMRNESEKIQVILADSYEDFAMGGMWVRKFLQAIEPKSASAGNNKELIKKIYYMTRGKK